MASQGASTNSRLSQMQMRFQQKQLQDREQRRVEIFGDREITASETNMTSRNVSNGKVRQMFDERRRGAGIDRSKPLNPIPGTRLATSTTILNTATTKSSVSLPSRPPKLPRAGPIVGVRQSVNGRRTLLGNDSLDERISNGGQRYDEPDNNNIVKDFASMNIGGTIFRAGGDRNNNSGSMSRGKSSNSIKLNPVVTKKSPTIATTRSSARQSIPSCSSSSNGIKGSLGKITSPSKKAPATSMYSSGKASSGKMSSSSFFGRTPSRASPNVRPPAQAPTPPGMGTCRYCGRHFIEERLAKHEDVCQKMAKTKRKVYDASKMRVKGTEAEKYMKKPQGSRTSSVGANYSTGTGSNVGLKKNNWRKKHEDFINAIRAAKQVQSHLAKGGKLSDLPPPPPSENPDYVQCPHCLRRFNEAAAARHIPKCATMLHNKPKLGAPAANKKR